MRKSFLFLFSIFISCSTIKENEVNGTYTWTKQGIGSKEIILEQNHFNYNLNIPLTTEKSAGIWSRDKNKIFLNSFFDYKTGYMTVEEKKAEESFILITGNNGYGVYGATIIINDTLSFQADEEGKVSLSEDLTLSSIKILWIDFYRNNTYKIKNPESNVFIIKLNENDPGKIYFENKKVKIRNGYLIIDNQKFIKQVAN